MSVSFFHLRDIIKTRLHEVIEIGASTLVILLPGAPHTLQFRIDEKEKVKIGNPRQYLIDSLSDIIDIIADTIFRYYFSMQDETSPPQTISERNTDPTAPRPENMMRAPMKEFFTKEDVLGALFDFGGYLTTQPQEITLSAHHSPTPYINALQEFASLRGLGENANVKDWDKALPKEAVPNTSTDNQFVPNIPSRSFPPNSVVSYPSKGRIECVYGNFLNSTYSCTGVGSNKMQAEEDLRKKCPKWQCANDYYFLSKSLFHLHTGQPAEKEFIYLLKERIQWADEISKAAETRKSSPPITKKAPPPRNLDPYDPADTIDEDEG